MDTGKSMNLNFKRMAATILSIFVILTIAFPMSGSAFAKDEPPQFSLNIRAYVEVNINYDLYILNTRTGIVERLTTLEDTGEYNPSWSPDGRKIVHDVAGANLNTLYITDVNTHVSTLLPGADGGNDAAWSPNGKWIVFDRRWNNDLNLYLLPPTGGTPKLVVSNAVNGDWSPNSQRLVFERDGALWTASVKGGDEKKIADAGYSPVWSPNNMWIAYDLNGDLWKVRVNAAGARVGNPIQITSDPANEGGATWSQDSRLIAFSSDLNGDYDIWQMSAAGGAPVRLVRTSIYGDYDPAYSNNGQYIAYDGAREPSQPYIAAFPKMDYIEGQDWPMGETVHLTIDDPATKIRPDFETEQPTVVTSWDPYTFWVQYYFSYDLKVGDRITETDGYVTRTYTVRNLDVTDMNRQADTVAGIADPGAVVYLWVWDHNESYMELTTKKDGKWLADFHSVGFELAEGMCGRAEVRDKIGNRTALDWCVPNPTFSIFPAWNYVLGQNFRNGATVYGTIGGKLADDGTPCATSGVANKPEGELNTYVEMYFWQPGCAPEVRDVVTLTDGDSTRTHIVRALTVTEVNEAENTVVGTADIGAVVNVSAYLPGFPTIDLTVMDGTWLADFDTLGVDLVGGTDLTCGNVRIQDEEGNTTAVAWCVP
jgi:Tol biopolymer transport system component